MIDPLKGIDSFACAVLKGAQEGTTLRDIFGIIRKFKQYHDRKHPKR